MSVNPSVKAQPYPYQIPPIEYLKVGDLNKLDPWDVQEFFRIEALLRSLKVMELYEKTHSNSMKGSSDSLYMNYRVYPGWNVLESSHHYLLDITRPGVNNLKEMFEFSRVNCGAAPKEWWLKEFRDALLADDPTFLYLKINAKNPKQKLLRDIGKLIDQQKLEIRETPGDSDWFHAQPKENHKPGDRRHAQWRKTKTFYDFDINAWIDYFKCYDLRTCEAKTYGQIAGKVYGDSKTKYENAEKAVKRVSTLIHYAQTKNWPPPTNFLNKKPPASSPL